MIHEHGLVAGCRRNEQRGLELTSRTIAAFQAAGVRSALYKLDGSDDAASAAAVVAQIHAGDPDASVLVLRRGASADRVDHWVPVAASQPGFDGFAIGRSLWWEPAHDWLTGRGDNARAIEAIAANYEHAVQVWDAGRRA